MEDKSLIEFYGHLFELKKLKRTGWINNQVANPESVAEHSFALSTLALVLAPKLKLDTQKVVVMALIHDLGESIIGDIKSPETAEEKANKNKIEQEAISQVLSFTGDSSADLESLWREFEDGSTPEGKFVKELDKIEMCLQALEYERQEGRGLDEFFNHTRTRLTIPELKVLFNTILEQRKS